LALKTKQIYSILRISGTEALAMPKKAFLSIIDSEIFGKCINISYGKNGHKESEQIMKQIL